MNNKGNNAIPSSKSDDELLTKASDNAYSKIYDEFVSKGKIPNNWNIVCRDKTIQFEDIVSEMVKKGIPLEKARQYYGEDCCIETDAHIIYIRILEDNVYTFKPIFIGEIKKQGTNDKRINEGKKKQAIGNAAADRVAKNYKIAADYCYLCDKDFFPYNVFLHGCDFDEAEISKTTKSKLEPFFGKLNTLNPFFDNLFPWTRKGGSCFYQKDKFNFEQLSNICFECCKIGILHYISKYK